MDLTNGWDFTKSEHRRRAWKQIQAEDPFCIIGSPPCTMFSMLQELTKAVKKGDPQWKLRHNKLVEEATIHINFCCSLYKWQLKRGKHFVHEHPWSARSWKLPGIESLMSDPRVQIAYTNMCQFGMTTHIDIKDGPRGPVAKPTGFMTSGWAMFEELNRKCKDNHVHIPLVGGRASACQQYPSALCEAICRGVAKQKAFDAGGDVSTGIMSRGSLCSLMTRVIEPCIGRKIRMHCGSRPAARPVGEWREYWVDNVHEPEGGCDAFGARVGNGTEEMKKQMDSLYERQGMPEAWDDMNNVFLDPKQVKAARAEEMAFFKKLGVYKRVPKALVKQMDGKRITVKWLDTNKGDRANPNYRSRLVGREYNDCKDDTLYASTPPLEALRMIVSHASTVDPAHPGIRRELMVNDVRRAYFYAAQQRNVFINLPAEDDEAQEGEVGQLMLCLYGTRDAAKEWQKTLSRHLQSIGFIVGRGHPSVFHHPGRDVRVLVHGDDYLSSGYAKDLDWLKACLEKQYELQSQRIGVGEGKSSEGKILNRIVRWTSNGFEMEADPRHCELVLKQLEIEDQKSLSSPGTEGKDEEDDDEDVQLVGENASNFRGIAARLNYLSADRPDIQYATKEICREMSAPTTGSWRRLVRIGRYLLGRRRLVWNFELQNFTDTVDAFSDANWAGCRVSRKSTSGGALMIGSHLIKCWAKTQATVAKSSAESELYGFVRATCETLGFISLSNDFGTDMYSRLHMDSTAARGIIDRQGLSKVRHLDVNLLWLQEQLARDRVPLLKVPGPENNADLMTKHLAEGMISKHAARMSLDFREGRSSKAANLQSVARVAKQDRQTKADEKLLSICENFQDGPGGDYWHTRGSDGVWVRVHATPRQALFTPAKVHRGPAHLDRLQCKRETVGVYDDGETFRLEDDWRITKQAHRILDKKWTGRTTFSVRNCTWR